MFFFCVLKLKNTLPRGNLGYTRGKSKKKRVVLSQNVNRTTQTLTEHLGPSPARFLAWQENSPLRPSDTSNWVADEKMAAANIRKNL